MSFKDHLEFYKLHNISPVHQDIKNLKKHFERRQTLYQRLGIPKIFFENKEILEVGPGSGHNSLYLSSANPKSISLVEPNTLGSKEIVELYVNFKVKHTKPTIIKKSLENFSTSKKYDFVIAESWLGTTSHELKLIKKLSRFVKKNGILIITLQSPVGMLANVMRRLIAYELIDEKNKIEKNTEILLKSFNNHLNFLKDMSRPHIDWIHDNLLNPAALTSYLTPITVLDNLKNFQVYNTYPKFINDWRWYKKLYGKEKFLNKNFIESWHMNVHNFFSTNFFFYTSSKKINIKFEKECKNLIDYLICCESLKIKPNKIKCDNILKNIFTISSKIDKAFIDYYNEFYSVYNQKNILPNKVSRMKLLKKTFGRELIYLSMLKK